MKKLLLLPVILFAYSCFAQEVKHVVIISIDGFRPDFYLDHSWHTPNIRKLMSQGVHAMGVNSVFPSMTYPSHTTILTGVQPAEHGIYYNAMFEATGSTGKIYWNDSAIKVPTIYTAARQKGLKVASIFWPVSAGAPVTYNIPDIGSMGEENLEKYSKPAGFLTEVKTSVFNSSGKIDIGRNQNVARIAAYVVQKNLPDLMTVHFFGVDHAQHVEGRNSEMTRESVADADSGVAIIVDALKKAGAWNNTFIIVTGDHGFHDVKNTLNPNVWLKNAGLANDVKKGDWKAQFFTVGGSAFLYVKNNESAVLTQVLDLLSNLPEEEKKLFAIIDREKLDKAGANPEVQLALTGLNNTSFGAGFTGAERTAGRGGAHGYLPGTKEIQTGFVASGPGIKTGVVINEMNVGDIAPIVSKLLKLSLPSAKGTVPEGLFLE
jgi:predicted AlkP superfamily pyrophosphatase or phosphodiesterase